MRVLLAILLVSSFANFASAYTFDKNVPADIQEQTRKDLEFMNTLQGKETSGLHGQIFGPLAGTSYQSFFEDRVKRIGLHTCGSANAVACVIPMMGSDKIWFTKNYINFSHPQIARLMVVYHEARHCEVKNGNWGHATCPDPFLNEKGEPMKSIWTGAALAGQPACDVTPFGSYGSSMILLKNVAKFCANCSEKVRMDAGIYADDQFGRVTDAGAREAIKRDLYSSK